MKGAGTCNFTIGLLPVLRYKCIKPPWTT